MTNEERRVALATARRKALEYAMAAETDPTASLREEARALADMWANIANAMKVGQALEADGVLEHPSHPDIITR